MGAVSEARLETRVRRAQERLDRIRDDLRIAALRARVRDIARRSGLTRTGGLALVAAIVPWVVARVVAGTALYVFAYTTILLVLAAVLLAPRRLRLTAERTGLYPRAQEGDRLEVTVTITAARGLSSFQVEERLPERLGTSVRVPIARVRAGGEFRHSYGIHCARRGVYTVGPLVAIAQDPVGVAQRETVLAEPFELLVHPRVSRVSDRPLTRLFEDPPIRPPVSRPWHAGLEFLGLRDFRPGDDLRRVVWRAMARTGRVMVREAEQGITDHITLILNTDRGVHSREGDHSESFETAVRACASLGVRHLTDGYEIRCETNRGPLPRRLLADPRRDAHTILITPRLSAEEQALLKLLTDRGVSMTVVAVIWQEEDADALGRAAVLGCQVAPVRIGEDLTAALAHDIGAGNRL